MSEEFIKKLIADLDKMSAPELGNAFPGAMDKIRNHITKMALSQVPPLLEKTIDKLLEIDVAQTIRNVPRISANFMEIFWEGIAELAKQSEEMQSLLEKTRDINVNIEASDSPFKGHFSVSRGTLSGGPEFFHFRDEDYRIMGTTSVLLELLTGRLPLGFSNPKLQTAGHSGFAAFVTPVVKGVASLIRGQ